MLTGVGISDLLGLMGLDHQQLTYRYAGATSA
jgi:hypothetical protein